MLKNEKNQVEVISAKNILITGGAGFIGTHLCQILATKNNIRIFDNLTRNSIKYTNLLKNNNVQFIEGDIRCYDQILSALDDVDIILHLAAIAGVSSYYKKPKTVIEVNYHGTKNILEAAREKNVNFFLDMSTSEIFGKMARFVNENDAPSSFPPHDMRSTYAKSKSLAEQMAFCYALEYGMSVLSIRPFNIYGPGQVGEGAISNMVKRALREEDLEITGDGSAVRAWCYIDDFVEGILRCLNIFSEIKAEAINIGNSQEIQTTLNLAKMIKRLSKSNSKIVFVDHPGTDIPIRIPKIDKAISMLNFRPKIDLETGIIRTIEWQKSISKL